MALTEWYKHLAGKNTLTGWEYLKRIRRSPAFGSIVFFPLVASFLTLSGTIQSLAFMPFPLEVSARVHLFYWSLFFLFAGTSIFSYYCPPMFVRYDTHLAYAKAELEILQNSSLCSNTTEFAKGRLEKHRHEVDLFRPDLVKLFANSIAELQAATKIDSGARVDQNVLSPMILAHWKFMNRANPRARVGIFILYSTGLFLIGLIVAISVVDVMYSYFN